jgi:hypothetical protein
METIEDAFSMLAAELAKTALPSGGKLRFAGADEFMLMSNPEGSPFCHDVKHRFTRNYLHIKVMPNGTAYLVVPTTSLNFQQGNF